MSDAIKQVWCNLNDSLDHIKSDLGELSLKYGMVEDPKMKMLRTTHVVHFFYHCTYTHFIIISYYSYLNYKHSYPGGCIFVF